MAVHLRYGEAIALHYFRQSGRILRAWSKAAAEFGGGEPLMVLRGTAGVLRFEQPVQLVRIPQREVDIELDSLARDGRAAQPQRALRRGLQR